MTAVNGDGKVDLENTQVCFCLSERRVLAEVAGCKCYFAMTLI